MTKRGGSKNKCVLNLPRQALAAQVKDSNDELYIYVVVIAFVTLFNDINDRPG
jgi:hypothetical protein